MSKPKSTEGSCLPRLKMGCCCALPTCCKVQGWLSLIGSVGMIIRYLLHIILVLNAVPNLYGECSVYGRKLDDDDCSILRIMVGVSFVAIGYSAVLFVCSIFFLKGIGQKKPEYMVHFIRFMWTNMVLCVILVGFLLLFFPSNGGTVLIIIVTVVASLGFSLYCLLCANSLYHDFLEERERSEQLGAVVSLSPSPPPYYSKN